MSYLWTGAYPRNTSNGDYGRFLFTANQTTGGNGPAFHSADGNRMVHHAHYPNCPNRHNNQVPHGSGQSAGGGNGSNGMADYTIEYGEDAVRAAMGGNMPDFQAQFQQQYAAANGGAPGSVGVNPQSIQMVNDGKSKMAMIPVVFSSEDGNNDTQSSCQSNGNGTVASNTSSEAANASNGISNNADVSHTVPENQEGAPAAAPWVKPPKPEKVIDAFNSVRKTRSNSQVKYGRHVRPSYWNPETPNPCRKKIGGGGDCLPELPKPGQSLDCMQEYPPTMYSNGVEGMANNQYNNEAAFVPPQNEYQSVQPPPSRARSLPQKKHVRSNYSLCGKCQKCKNLSSETVERPILTFPTYSQGARQRLGQQHALSSSSNLGQSAKNFRAIRFSSTNM